MQHLLLHRYLRETLIEDRDKLKAEERLNARKHHTRFFDGVLRPLVEFLLLDVSVGFRRFVLALFAHLFFNPHADAPNYRRPAIEQCRRRYTAAW